MYPKPLLLLLRLVINNNVGVTLGLVLDDEAGGRARRSKYGI